MSTTMIKPATSNEGNTRELAERRGRGTGDVRREVSNPRRRGASTKGKSRRTSSLKPPRESSPVRVDTRHSGQPRRHAPPVTSESNRPQKAQTLSSYFASQPLEKSFVMFGFVVAIVLVLAFGADLIAGWPFHKASTLFDVTSVVCGLALAYLSWDTFKDLRG